MPRRINLDGIVDNGVRFAEEQGLPFDREFVAGFVQRMADQVQNWVGQRVQPEPSPSRFSYSEEEEEEIDLRLADQEDLEDLAHASLMVRVQLEVPGQLEFPKRGRKRPRLVLFFDSEQALMERIITPLIKAWDRETREVEDEEEVMSSPLVIAINEIISDDEDEEEVDVDPQGLVLHPTLISKVITERLDD